MALKDKWEDLIDDESEIKAEDINDIARSVIETEETVSSHDKSISDIDKEVEDLKKNALPEIEDGDDGKIPMVKDGEYVLGTFTNLSSFVYTTVTLLASAWVEVEENLYSQVVDIEGITEYSMVDIQPSVEQSENISFVTENDDGVVTVYAFGGRPSKSYEVQATIAELSKGQTGGGGNDTPSYDKELPEVTDEDNGKILCVVDGAWTAVAIADSPIKTYIDDYINEALGGDY